jgi:hypothetical protein
MATALIKKGGLNALRALQKASTASNLKVTGSGIMYAAWFV